MYRCSRGGVFNLGIAAALILFLSACSKPDGKPDGVNRATDAGATFLVTSLKADAVLVNKKSAYTNKNDGGGRISSWRVPRAVNYSFSACIEDRATHYKAKGPKFRVEYPDTKTAILDVSPTTPSGCFTWSETIPFAYYVRNSRWVVVERDIVGDGIHTGRQRVRFAINPWAVGDKAREGGDVFKFLREETLPEEKMVPYEQFNEAVSGALMGPDEMVADGVQVKTIRNSERSSGTFVKYEITVEPKVAFRGQLDLDKERWEPIGSGDFFVVAHLVVDKGGENLDQKVILGSGESIAAVRGQEDAKRHPGVVVDRNLKTRAKDGQEIHIQDKREYPVNGYGRVIDGKLVLRMDAWVEGRVAQGNLRLVMKLIPRGVEGLKSFEGIYDLGHLKNPASSFQGDLITECRDAQGSCSVARYLRDAHNFREAYDAKIAQQASPYLFEKVRLRFVQVEPGETATARTVRYQASTCVLDWFTGDKVVGLPFKVSYKDTSEVKDVETLADGCISWTSSIFHNYYEPEKFIKKEVIFAKGEGVSAERSFFINPWDDKFTFGFDEGDFPEELLNSKKVDSRFFLADYGYHTVRFQYNIDSLMGLEVKKTVLMELQPRVLRYSGIINARKMTEPLRDGIWLMKVAIQKNYLDPAEAGVVIDKLQENQSMIRLKHEPTSPEVIHRHKRLKEMGIQARTKEYVTTRTALVRVTDGVIIQPVELTMQDLRMMRVRANFLVQLEAVDERALQFDNELRHQVGKVFKDLDIERAKIRSKRTPENLAETEEQILRRENDELEQKKSRYLARIKGIYTDIGRQLNATGAHISLVPKGIDLKCDDKQRPIRANPPPNETPDAKFEREIMEALECRLRLNDFTTLKLPTCGEDNCKRFREENSFLKTRTFVGPVIFLHNAYKDSVRATDNLDEARCGDSIVIQDKLTEDIRRTQAEMFDQFLKPKEKELQDQAEKAAQDYRPNTLYNFGEYFGSLRHLCNLHVDDLIERDKNWRELYEKNGPVVASPYNFGKAYNVDFLSLTNESLYDIEITDDKLKECGYDLQSCIDRAPKKYEKTDHSIQLESALSVINRTWQFASPNIGAPGRWFTDAKDLDDVLPAPWNKETLRSAIFDTKEKALNSYDIQRPRSANFAGCALLAWNTVEYVRKNGGVTPFGSKTFNSAAANLTKRCLSGANVSFDRKLRVFETGKDNDPYLFLGGMNLNLNVGQGFSVSRSQNYNWSLSASAGVELFDLVGPAKVSNLLTKDKADFHGAMLKPLSLKGGVGAGYGESFGSSEGTSIADSTYLVAQIAGFKVRLDKFERCAVVRFSPDFISEIENAPGSMSLVGFLNQNRKLVNLRRGIMVCEGQLNREPRTVKESYFYFTQHFTEGDMLDQADLYNHPWLLALRGQRDFGVFLRRIRGQEPITIGNFVKGVWVGKERTLDWPLDHMLRVYRKDGLSPSFPGYYTELRENEQGTELPLERTMYEPDSSCELRSADRRPRGSPICDQRFQR